MRLPALNPGRIEDANNTSRLDSSSRPESLGGQQRPGLIKEAVCQST